MTDAKNNELRLHLGLNESTRLDNCDLVTGLTVADATNLSDALASMSPWKELGMEAVTLNAYLLKEDASLLKLSIRVSDCLAGVLMLRIPWLRGPYLELFCVLPKYQGSGIGRSALKHIMNRASKKYPNIWVCASEFNDSALRFYEHQGFTRICVIDELVTPNHNEILLRRRLTS
jgi:ribosomal protein S18 acetylase RimI-like enzyme